MLGHVLLLSCHSNAREPSLTQELLPDPLQADEFLGETWMPTYCAGVLQAHPEVSIPFDCMATCAYHRLRGDYSRDSFSSVSLVLHSLLPLEALSQTKTPCACCCLSTTWPYGPGTMNT